MYRIVEIATTCRILVKVEFKERLGVPDFLLGDKTGMSNKIYTRYIY